MIPLCIANATHIMTAPHGRDDVNDLHVIKTACGCFVSRWEPTPKELETLKNGGSIELWISGVQPPVYVGVAEPTIDDAT